MKVYFIKGKDNVYTVKSILAGATSNGFYIEKLVEEMVKINYKSNAEFKIILKTLKLTHKDYLLLRGDDFLKVDKVIKEYIKSDEQLNVFK